MIALAVPAAAGVVLLLLAGWLMRVAADNRAARAFAVVLTARALSMAALSMTPMARSVEGARFFGTAYTALLWAVIFAAAYFASVYPRPRASLPKGPAGPLAFLAGLVLVELPLLLNPDLARPLAALDGAGMEAVAPWFFSSRQGPYGPTMTLLDLSMAIIAVTFCREYLRSPRGRRRGTLLLVSLGFFAPAACSCLMAAAGLRIRGVLPAPADPSIFNALEMVAFGVWFVAMVGLLVYLVVAALRSDDPELRRDIGLFATVLFVSATLGATIALVPPVLTSIRAIFVMLAGWSTLGALLVTYGVLRHRLFDIDLRVKLGLERGTVAAAFVATFFLVSEASAQIFEDFSGSSYLGIGAAALLLFALQPLQRMAESVIGDAMPATRPLDELGDDDGVRFYRETVELMWMDGSLSARDRLVLGRLRQRLGIAPERAEAVEIEVLGGGARDDA